MGREPPLCLYLTAEKRKKFLGAAAHEDRKTRTFCAVLAHTGCRISEALALTPGFREQWNRKPVCPLRFHAYSLVINHALVHLSQGPASRAALTWSLTR